MVNTIYKRKVTYTLFSQLLANEIHILAIFFTFGDYIDWKSDCIWQFKRNSFSNDFGTGTLII